MKKLYSLTVRITTFLIAIIAINQGVVMSMPQHMSLDTTKSKPAKISDQHIYRLTSYTNSSKSNYIPFKSSSVNTISGVTFQGIQSDPASALNVKIYPVPVSDQINISYHLSKDSNVTIEIFDLLGSKVSTLLSQHLPAGDQKNTFPITSKLNSGFYTVRVTVGNQPVTRRISVI